MKQLKILLLLVLLFGVTGALVSSTQADTSPALKIEPGLLQTMEASGEGLFFVSMTQQADLNAAYEVEEWQERGEIVYEALRQTAATSQADLLRYLEAQKRNGKVKAYKPYFIVNMVLVDGSSDVLNALAAREEVAYIYAAPTLYLVQQVSPGVLVAEWGVAQIRANDVWADFNTKGEGIVVANIDSGVDYDHPALVNQYRGTVTGSDDYSFYDPANDCGGTVCDDNVVSHGTHTMGTMVGDDGTGNQIGVAPGAMWIAAKACNNLGACSSGDILDSMEWMLAPCAFGEAPGHVSCDPEKRPNIVNNSYGGPGVNGLYQAAVDAWHASGIIPVYSAGNSGPGASTVGYPGNYCNVIGVGATDSGDVIASFSSRGPGQVACPDKPDVSAPGVNIRSSIDGGLYDTLDGTSMAAPHVAGCIALINSLGVNMTYDDAFNALTTTAVDLGAAGFDNDYGYGRIDCYAAVSSFSYCQGHIVTLAGTSLADTLVGTPGKDVIHGFEGDDTIYAQGGNDIICAGDGDDTVYGGPGSDSIRGGPGDDEIHGGDGRDAIYGLYGNDTLYGGQGLDTLDGGAGDDFLYGKNGYDFLDGGLDTDYCEGGAAEDAFLNSSCETQVP